MSISMRRPVNPGRGKIATKANLKKPPPAFGTTALTRWVSSGPLPASSSVEARPVTHSNRAHEQENHTRDDDNAINQSAVLVGMHVPRVPLAESSTNSRPASRDFQVCCLSMDT